jgi:pimeloyl-ACP methyl ester carboxylesterase
LKLALLLIGIVLCLDGRAQEIVTLGTRPRVTQSFFVADMGARKPEAAALLLIGGGGVINLRNERGQVRFSQGNFLPRSRREFIRNGILPVILDVPSDQRAGMTDAFRESAAHATDVRAVVAEIRKRHPGLPLFLVGTSRGTISAEHLAAALGAEVAGVVLSASFLDFDWSKLRVPVLLVHHADDGCRHTPYREAARLAKRYPLVSVHGGKPAESGPCEALSPHGFLGQEAATVDAIAAWMRGKPFPHEVK